MRADEKDAFFVGRNEIAGACGRALSQARAGGGEVGVPVGTAFAIFQSVYAVRNYSHRFTRGLCSAILSRITGALWSEKNRNFVPQR